MVNTLAPVTGAVTPVVETLAPVTGAVAPVVTTIAEALAPLTERLHRF